MPSVCPQLTPEALIQAATPALSAKKQAQRGLRNPGLYVEIQALSPPVGHCVTPEQGWDPATFPADGLLAARYGTRLGALDHQPVRKTWCLVPLGPTVFVAIELGCQEHSREA